MKKKTEKRTRVEFSAPIYPTVGSIKVNWEITDKEIQSTVFEKALEVADKRLHIQWVDGCTIFELTANQYERFAAQLADLKRGITHYVIGYIRRFVGIEDSELQLSRRFEVTVKGSDEKDQSIPFLYTTKREALKDLKEWGCTDDNEYAYPAIVKGDELTILDESDDTPLYKGTLQDSVK